MADTKSAVATATPDETTTKPQRKKGGWLLKVLLGLAAVIVVLAVIVAMQPDDFRVTRTATIDAPAGEVFAQVNDLHNWQAWSPWAKLDPNAENSFEGPPEGEGAAFKWSGNDQIGEGKMTITESRPNELVRFKLEFVRPMEDTGNSEFVLQPKGDQTTVQWSMYGKQNYVCKALCTFGILNMDKMLGAQFEEGLANMKQVVESKSDKPASPAEEGENS
jgi:hypothetical protein